jgi:transcription elongation factor GreA
VASVHLTHAGYEMLRRELHTLIEERRPQVMEDLARAREFGDISENAEYETAKRDQGMIEGRIHELESLLASVEIIELPTDIDEAIIGARVRVENLDAKQEREYQLVSEQEAHLLPDRLNVDSPLGKALLGTRVGDMVVFEAPAGTRRFKVLALVGANGSGE